MSGTYVDPLNDSTYGTGSHWMEGMDMLMQTEQSVLVLVLDFGNSLISDEHDGHTDKGQMTQDVP